MPKKALAQTSIREVHSVHIGPRKLTRFERARVVGARSLQIAMGAPTLLDIPEARSSMEIAMRELEENVLPMSIRRSLPDGCSENIALSVLAGARKVKREHEPNG